MGPGRQLVALQHPYILFSSSGARYGQDMSLTCEDIEAVQSQQDLLVHVICNTRSSLMAHTHTPRNGLQAHHGPRLKWLF